MPTTTANAASVPVGSDPYALTADLKKTVESVRSIIPISTAAQLTALPGLFPGGVLPVPTYVQRTDLAGTPLFSWDGAEWVQLTGRAHAEFTSAGLVGPAGNGVNWGALNPVAARTFNNDFVESAGGGNIRFLREGTYAVTAVCLPGGNPGNINSGGVHSATGEKVFTQGRLGTYGDWEQAGGFNIYAVPNDTVFFYTANANGVSFGCRVIVDRLSQ